MALGFGFNKTKIMQAAERNVLQGKLSNAIAEYEKVIAHEARDLTVLNTLGDLYVRTGRVEDALQCFRRVADAYAADGFAMKAIAMYKKITKLNAQSLDCLLKLGELYSLQGLFSEARSQYIAAAEHQLSRGDSEGAAGVYRKALELDPENAHMQQRLAELYLSSGRQEQATEIYIMAAQSLHCRGRHSAAIDIIEKLLKVSPNHAAALMLAGKISSDAGDHARAIRRLESLTDLDQRPDALRQLIRARIACEQLQKAEQDARKLLANHQDGTGALSVVEAMIQANQSEAGLRLLQDLTEPVMTAQRVDVMRLLQAAVSQQKDSIPVLENGLQISRRLMEGGSVGEIAEPLAQAYVQAGQLDRAQTLYRELSELEPDNPMHKQNLAQLAAKTGEGEASAKSPVETPDALTQGSDPAPPPSDSYPAEVVQAIESALTDADLFQSYNSPQRALAALEEVLPLAPADTTLNQRLAAAYVRVERYADAADRFAILRQAYQAQGLLDESQQCATMEGKYRQRAAASPGTRPATRANDDPANDKNDASSSAPEFELAAGVTPGDSERADDNQAKAIAKPSPANEWDELASEEETAEPNAVSSGNGAATSAETDDVFLAAIEEARFYLLHGLTAEGNAALAHAEQLRPGAPEVMEIRREFGPFDGPAEANQVKATAKAADSTDCEPAEKVGAVPAEEIKKPAPAPVEEAAPAPPEEEAALSVVDPHDEPLAAVDASNGQPLPETQESDVTKDSVGSQAAPTNGRLPAEPEGDVFDLGWHLDSALPADFDLEVPQPAAGAAAGNKSGVRRGPEAVGSKAAEAAPPAANPAANKEAARKERTTQHEPDPAADRTSKAKGAATSASNAKRPPQAKDEESNPFNDIFEEFRSSVEQTDGDGDLDQHYNMGIALKDMGLLDEAVGELQRVCNALERGAYFPDAVQAYTWLAHCLVERGAPQAAVRWYKRALAIPTLDADAQTAIHYELGLAYEKSGSKGTALEHFMEAYGSNIDYRDVAERIEALRG